MKSKKDTWNVYSIQYTFIDCKFSRCIRLVIEIQAYKIPEGNKRADDEQTARDSEAI